MIARTIHEIWWTIRDSASKGFLLIFVKVLGLGVPVGGGGQVVGEFGVRLATFRGIDLFLRQIYRLPKISEM